MKRTIALIMVLMLSLSFASCSKNTEKNEKPINSASDVTETDKNTASDGEAESSGEEIPVVSNPVEEISETGKAPSKNEEAPKPSNKPAQPPVEKPEQKPQQKPDQKPEQKPAEKPEEITPKTVGNILLADFKAKAASSSDVLSLAKTLLSNSVIKFKGDALSVEPGYLTGFDNEEITGFKSGAVFLPMIGTIPFVGYVFELEDGADVSAFISTLKSSANLRWNICTSADEMVAGSVGNKVFFVMCPNSFGE